MNIPGIDQNICNSWTEQQIDLYNKTPFYLMRAEAQARKNWETWVKLLGTTSWKPNQGPIMRQVAVEASPVMRQMAFPERLNVTPTVDVYATRERITDAYLHHHDFVSPSFYFLPSFQDFMKHIHSSSVDINRQIGIYTEHFYRTRVFHHAPYVWTCGVGLTPAPTGDGNLAGTSGKTTAWIQSQMALMAGTGQGRLTFQELFKILNAAEQEVGMTPFEGTGMPKADSNPLNQKFCLVCSSEDWNGFVDDPWLKENRPLNMNIVTDGFHGDLWGRVRAKLERYPIRMKLDANFSPTFPDPETIELNAAQEDYNRTKPNPQYAKPENAQVGVAYLVGGASYEVIKPGPPPEEFVRNLDQGAVVKMNWNGKTYLTKQFITPCKDTDGNDKIDINSFGRYIRAQGTVALGITGINPQNVLPIFFQRRAGVTTVS